MMKEESPSTSINVAIATPISTSEMNDDDIETIEPKLIMAIEHVPCCRKMCEDSFKCRDDCRLRCITDREMYNANYESCHTKWKQCGKNEDDKCIQCCKLNFGERCQKKCTPCFQDANNKWALILLLSLVIPCFACAIIIPMFWV